MLPSQGRENGASESAEQEMKPLNLSQLPLPQCWGGKGKGIGKASKLRELAFLKRMGIGDRPQINQMHQFPKHPDKQPHTPHPPIPLWSLACMRNTLRAPTHKDRLGLLRENAKTRAWGIASEKDLCHSLFQNIQLENVQNRIRC